MSMLFRERNVRAPSAIHAIARTPSHLISNSQLGSENGCSTSVASIGSTRDGIALLRAPCASLASIGRGLRFGGASSAISVRLLPVNGEPSCSPIFLFGSSAASLSLISSPSLHFPAPFLVTATHVLR